MDEVLATMRGSANSGTLEKATIEDGWRGVGCNNTRTVPRCSMVALRALHGVRIMLAKR
jgi:hypothetical protein